MAGVYGHDVVDEIVMIRTTYVLYSVYMLPHFHGVVGELALLVRVEGLPADSAGVAGSLPGTAPPGERMNDTICHATGHDLQ